MKKSTKIVLLAVLLAAVWAAAAAGQEPYRGMALDILGPAPAPVVKVNNRYRYRVTVIGRNDKTLRGLLSAFMKEFSRRPEHKALHIYTDCNLMD